MCVPPPPFCRGGGGGGEPPTKFPKREGLTGPQLLEGVAGKEREREWLFSGGGGGLQLSHKK